MTKPFYKFIFLIIDSNTPYNDIYKSHRERWIKSFKLYTNTLYLFIKFNRDQKSDILIENNYITFKGDESYIPGILHKSLKTIKLVSEFYRFEYIIRTNLSSCWQVNNLEQMLNKYHYLDNNIYAVIGNYNGINFPSGAGIIIPYKSALFIANNSTDFNNNFADDVEFGTFLKKHNISLVGLQRCDYFIAERSSNDIITYLQNKNNFYHYRILYDRDEQDSYINSIILDYIY